MIYRLKELKGDTIAVPQLVFSKLGIAEEYNVRVALYVRVRWLSGRVQGFWNATKKTPHRAQSPAPLPLCAGRRSPPPAAPTL